MEKSWDDFDIVFPLVHAMFVAEEVRYVSARWLRSRPGEVPVLAAQPLSHPRGLPLPEVPGALPSIVTLQQSSENISLAFLLYWMSNVFLKRLEEFKMTHFYRIHKSCNLV